MAESLRHDVRFALRQMKRAPGFTAVALAAIAVGIGANSTVFSFFNALQLKTVRAPGAERLVALHRVDRRVANARARLTADEYRYYREHVTTLYGVAVQDWSWTWLAHGDRSVEWQGGQVSANYFGVLGVKPYLGGFFSGDGDVTSVVLSHRAWIRAFDSDPAVVGRTVRVNQQPLLVVGVAPEGFAGIYVGDSLDSWTVAASPSGAAFGRLQTAGTLDQASAELAMLSGRLAEGGGEEDRNARVIVEPLKGVHPDTRQALAMFPSLLAATTICLLAIACANLAGLLLARADARRREMAVRVSLGASRRRLVRQLLTESVVTAALGGVLGLWLAVLGCRLLEGFFGYQIPDMRLTLDWQVVSVSAILSVLTGIVFGMAPAWHATRSDPATALRGRSYGGLSAVAVQVALSAVLLICAGLLFQSMRAVLVRDGVDADKVAHFRLRPSRLGYSLERARAYQRDVIRAVEAIPGVERAVIARVPPERGWCCEIAVAPAGQDPFDVSQNEVSPGFLAAMGISLVDGRDFADGDRDMAIVNQSLAARLWPDQRAAGAELLVQGRSHRVIGVARDTHALRPGEQAHPFLYLPMWGRDARDPRLFVRVNGRAAPMLEQLRRALVSVDPQVHVGQESTLAARSEMSYQRERLLAAMLEFTGIVAVLLSAVGLYGLVSYQVVRRTREIGIRMALGAQAGDVIAWIVRRGLVAAAVGLAAGALIAWQAARLLTGFLYGVEPADTPTFAAAAAVLGGVAATASLLPARAVSHIDPAIALRHE